jgi:sigma-70-like protein
VDDLPGRPPGAELVAAARTGAGQEAFAELVSRHWPAAVALAARVLGSPDLAADAGQEAAVAALVSLDRLREPGRFGAWYCGITLNVARNWPPKPSSGSARRRGARAIRNSRPGSRLGQPGLCRGCHNHDAGARSGTGCAGTGSRSRC